MKNSTSNPHISKKNGYQSDDDNIRYKLNAQYFNQTTKIPAKIKGIRKHENEDDSDVRYKFPTSPKSKTEAKQKPKIKVNFWSHKNINKAQKTKENKKEKINRRHTYGGSSIVDVAAKPKPVKVRKRVSFLPSPIFLENNVPMVTVPDDLTINLNEEEANDLRDDLNSAFVNLSNNVNQRSAAQRKSTSSVTQTSPRGSKRKHTESKRANNENDLEFFSKYVVHKLRRMDTDQRIYSENLINTVLMLGQLGRLSGKSKIQDA